MKAPSRSRAFMLWTTFFLAAAVAGLAIFRLYETAKTEIAEQNKRVLAQERMRGVESLRAFIEDVKISTLSDLVSFHVDGLESSLRQWDEANEVIVGTFVWEPKRGFIFEGQQLPGTPSPEELKGLWTEFRRWRATNSGAKVYSGGVWNRFESESVSTIDNPRFEARDLGFQAENLDIIAHEGRRADPWAGWAGARDNPTAPWIFWYQTGFDEPVRGAFLDVRLVAQQTQNELAGTELARLIVEPSASGKPPASVETRGEPIAGFPSYRFVVDPGELFVRKQGNARLTGAIALMVFAIFVGGGATLAIYTARQTRDAENKLSFVSQVSHELRTPLTSIRMYADLLTQRQISDDKRIKFGATISTESVRLAGLIDRLLVLNALERGTTHVAREPIDIARYTRDVVEEMSNAIAAAGITHYLTIQTEPLMALSDCSTLKQALINLIENAIKYAGRGTTLDISVGRNAGNVFIDVSDTGPGVPKAIRDRAFEPFVQGGQTLTDKSPGVGLGLSIARGLLRQTGGDLVLLSSSIGAHFQMRLPAAVMGKADSPISS